MGSNRWAWVSTLALWLALTGGVLLALSGPGYRMGWFTLGTALQRVLPAGAFAGVAGLAVAVAALALNKPRVNGRAFKLAGLAFFTGLIVAGVPWQWQRLAQRVPRIHDISTDSVDVPGFTALAGERRRVAAPNGLEYSAEVAAQQREGYPDLGTLRLPMSRAAVFDKALALVTKNGWIVAVADPGDGRIEATATTFWFGFKDDIVLRIADDNGQSRVDMRSASRVGLSDVGTNARRIREFFAALKS